MSDIKQFCEYHSVIASVAKQSQYYGRGDCFVAIASRNDGLP